MNVDIVIIGAGAAGMMCAAQAGYCGKQVLVIDHADKPGEKIRISGGGRCNFTNSHCSPKNFLSENPHFCKSALSRYRPKDFIELVDRYNIAWHEKSKGQLFCDGKSQQIIDMLIAEMDNAGPAVAWHGYS
jgi:predicted Rossmann fold flavoprotein